MDWNRKPLNNLRTYRVWLSNGSAVLVDAISGSHAMTLADLLCDGDEHPKRAECLDNLGCSFKKGDQK